MKHYRKFIIAASPLVMIASLTACSGGGNSSAVSATPPTSTASSPASTNAAVIGAPAIAAVPNASLFPFASDGGATIQSRAKTVFPLLESVVSISAGKVVADTATINTGASLAFDSSNNSYVIDIKNAALGISNVTLNSQISGVSKTDFSGGKSVFLGIADPSTSNLSWTTLGYWDVVMGDGARTQSNFVTGYVTPAASMPTQGTATFSGTVNGESIAPQAGQTNGVGYFNVSGNASLLTNFANGTVNGNLTQMVTTGFDGDKQPWNSVSVSGTFTGSNMFGGTAAVTSAPSNVGSLSGSAKGTLAGTFFGPKAQELGAVWTLSDGTGAAFGTIAAKAGP